MEQKQGKGKVIHPLPTEDEDKTAEVFREYIQNLARFYGNIAVIRANNSEVADTLMKKFEACSLSKLEPKSVNRLSKQRKMVMVYLKK